MQQPFAEQLSTKVLEEPLGWVDFHRDSLGAEALACCSKTTPTK
jgi:hypothetical protein